MDLGSRYLGPLANTSRRRVLLIIYQVTSYSVASRIIYEWGYVMTFLCTWDILLFYKIRYVMAFFCTLVAMFFYMIVYVNVIVCS